MACGVQYNQRAAFFRAARANAGCPVKLLRSTQRTNMELSIRTRDVKLTDALKEQITGRLEFALDAFQHHIEDVFVYLMDLNGPKGGVDKLCQITVRARRIGDVAVRETGTTFQAALNRAARRLKYRVSEALRAGDSLSRESIRTAQAA
jgi:ribosome-associated translation inhibitor RaiA